MPDEENRPETAQKAAPESGEPKYPGKGFRVGEYVIVDTLGHGSMATVFLAKDSTGHEVALKLFQEGPGVSPTMLERFRREAEASKKLRRHPNIMKVYATGKDGPYHYIVMEAIKNSRTLEDILEVSPMSIEAVVQTIIKIARALNYAHSRNIVHRDVKPTNIMIDEFGEPLLTDFGVAALIDWPSFTMSGALTGTPLYMSPEQARAERVGPASDIYSIGVVLYEALTGVLPYSTQHAAPVKNVLEAVKNEQPRRPRFYRKDISPDLEAVILKALEKDPAKRYEDADAFANDLERAITGRHVTARLFSYWERLMFLARRYDQLVVASTVMIFMAAGAGLYFRHRLQMVHYENLLSMVHLRNFTARMAEASAATPAAQTPSAWNEIRLARRAMGAGNWTAARAGFISAVDLSRNVADTRTMATAQLDLARCETMMGNFDAATQAYRSILKNPDASPSVGDYAQLEALILTLLKDDRAAAVEILALRRPPPDGPIRDAINCLSGDMDTAALLRKIESMPPRFQNDAHLAVALRYHLDGNDRNFASQLRRCIQASSPSTEWPAPFAKMLRRDVQD